MRAIGLGHGRCSPRTLRHARVEAERRGRGGRPAQRGAGGGPARRSTGWPATPQRRARDFSTLFEEAPIGLGIAEDVDCRQIVPNRALRRDARRAAGREHLADGGRRRAHSAAHHRPDGTPLSGRGAVAAARGADRAAGARRGRRRHPPRRHAHLAARVRGAAARRRRPAARRDRRVPRRQRPAARRRGSSAFWPRPPGCSTTRSTTTATLGQLVRLAVPQMADYSLLDIVTPEGEVVRAGLAHRDPAREAQLTRRAGADPGRAGHPRQSRPAEHGQGRAARCCGPTSTAASSEGLGLRRDQIEFVLSVDVELVRDGAARWSRDRVIGAFAWMRHTGRTALRRPRPRAGRGGGAPRRGRRGERPALPRGPDRPTG